MIETLTLITMATLFLIFFRPGKTPPLENPLVINRLGHYQITLAPQLNLAQPLVEAIAKQLGKPADHTQSSSTQCFEVRDKEVTAHGSDAYLLAITQRNGMFYFQATTTQAAEPEARIAALREFADKVLSSVPDTGNVNEQIAQQIVSAAQAAAQKRGCAIALLSA